MASRIKVDEIAGATGNTITIPSGQTLDISATTLTLPSTIVTTTGAETLTNKTLTLPTIDNIKIGYSTTATATGTTTLTVSSNLKQYFTGSTTQTIVLPVVTTLTLGHTFEIHNNSSGSLTVNSSGSNLVGTINANTTATCTCILTTGTTAASWDFDLTGFTTALPVTRGGTGLTALGSSLQVLRVNSGATALEFTTPAVASSDYVLLATTTASSSSTISFDGYFSSTYDTYVVRYYDIYNSSASHLKLRYRRSNADITASSYKSTIHRTYSDLNDSNSTDAIRSSWNNDVMTITSGDTPTAIATSPRLQGELMLFNPLNTATYKAIQSRTTFSRDNANDTLHISTCYGRLEDSTSALSGLTFFPGSGNFTTGTFKLYGIK